MIPFFQQRIGRTGVNTTGMPNIYAKLTKPVIEYMKMFYADVANIPATAVLLSYEFFGNAHIVFGTDYPFGPPLSQTIAYMAELGIGQEEQEKVFSTNCETMLNLR